LKGHDFSRAESAPKLTRALQAAEKLTLAVNRGCFVSGRDLSRADNANRMTWALQAAEKLGNLDKAGGKRPSGAKQAAEKLFLSMSLWRHLFSTGVWFMKEVCVEKTKSSLRCTAM
jgi:hypothetical protein